MMPAIRITNKGAIKHNHVYIGHDTALRQPLQILHFDQHPWQQIKQSTPVYKYIYFRITLTSNTTHLVLIKSFLLPITSASSS